MTETEIKSHPIVVIVAYAGVDGRSRRGRSSRRKRTIIYDFDDETSIMDRQVFGSQVEEGCKD